MEKREDNLMILIVILENQMMDANYLFIMITRISAETVGRNHGRFVNSRDRKILSFKHILIHLS